jgi:hypothetical protein
MTVIVKANTPFTILLNIDSRQNKANTNVLIKFYCSKTQYHENIQINSKWQPK